MPKATVMVVLAGVFAVAGCGGTTDPNSSTPPKPATDPASVPGFRVLQHGPRGGVVWAGRILNPFAAWDRRETVVYLPPGYTRLQRYPVLYLLHGFWGSPSGFVVSFRFADTADQLIENGQVRPFIAVMPPGGELRRTGRTSGEWAGVWERFVVETVVPWIDLTLPTLVGAETRAIAGLSAGGFGAVDIALRHLGLFSVAESWEGYFKPFRDGPFVHASTAELATHDPTLLVRENADYVRAHLRFFLSTGRSHGVVNRSWTFAFAAELRSLGIAYQLWVLPPGRTRFGRLQLPDALRFAEPPG